MGCRVKLPELLQFFAKKFQTDRQLSADREQIHNVAAAAPAALLLNRGNPLITQTGELLGQILKVDAGAFAQREALISQHGRWRQMRLQRTLGGHDHSLPPLVLLVHQLTQHLQLTPGDLAGGIKRFVGRSLARWIELRRGPAH